MCLLNVSRNEIVIVPESFGSVEMMKLTHGKNMLIIPRLLCSKSADFTTANILRLMLGFQTYTFQFSVFPTSHANSGESNFQHRMNLTNEKPHPYSFQSSYLMMQTKSPDAKGF